MGKKKKGAGQEGQDSALLREMEKVGKLYGDLEPGLRKDVLELTADLRTKWLALGAKLKEVRENLEFVDWGYVDWTDYCERELRMKRAAANAMIDAYGWMRDHHPEVVNIQAPKWLPDMRAVQELMAAERKLIYAGVDSATASDRVKEVEAKIIGGELDEKEARKAARELTAKPRKEPVGEPPTVKSAGPTKAQARDEFNAKDEEDFETLLARLEDVLWRAKGAAVATADPGAPYALAMAVRECLAGWRQWEDAHDAEAIADDCWGTLRDVCHWAESEGEAVTLALLRVKTTQLLEDFPAPKRAKRKEGGR